MNQPANRQVKRDGSEAAGEQQQRSWAAGPPPPFQNRQLNLTFTTLFFSFVNSHLGWGCRGRCLHHKRGSGLRWEGRSWEGRWRWGRERTSDGTSSPPSFWQPARPLQGETYQLKKREETGKRDLMDIKLEDVDGSSIALQLFPSLWPPFRLGCTVSTAGWIDWSPLKVCFQRDADPSSDERGLKGTRHPPCACENPFTDWFISHITEQPPFLLNPLWKERRNNKQVNLLLSK